MNYITTTELAAEVGVPARTIKRWCRAGRIPTVGKLAGATGAYLIDHEGVERARELAAQVAS